MQRHFSVSRLYWCLLIGVAFLGTFAFAQAPPAEWKPITPEELALKDNPALPGASAILLDRDSYVDDAKSYLTEYYRIKIFKEEGRKFADIEIPYVPKSDEVVDIRARTVRADGTTAEFHGEIFDKVIVKSKRFKYQAKTFTLADAQAGGIIDYSYKMIWHQHAPDVLKNPGSYLITGVYSIPTMQWQIQHELYTRHARFSVHPLPKGNLQWSLIRGPLGAAVVRQPDGTAVLEVKNVAPLDEEEFMPPPAFINSRVHFYYLLSFMGTSVGNERFYWTDVGRRAQESVEAFIGHSKFVQQVTSQTVSPSDPVDTKLRKIYERVQQVRNLSFEPERTRKELKQENLKENNSAEDVLKRGFGYGDDINYLFVAMARAAGMDAYVVKVVARDKHIFDPAVLDPSQFNAMLVNVHVGNEDRFFDPATRFCPFEMIPWSESGVKGLRLSPVSTLIGVPGYHSEMAVTRRTADLKLEADGTLGGKFHVAFSGQDALEHRVASYDDDDAGRRKTLETEIKSWLPNNAVVEITSSSGWESSQGDLHVDGTISAADFAPAMGKRLLVPTTVFRRSKGNPFKSNTRSYPIYFAYSSRTDDIVTLALPEGFRVDSVPDSHFEVYSDAFRYQNSATKVPEGLQLKRSMTVDGFIFDKGNYPAIKHFYESVLGGDSEQAVLQRADSAK